MRNTIQSNKALYRDLAMESLAVIAWYEREGMHLVKTLIDITEQEQRCHFMLCFGIKLHDHEGL